MHTTSVIEITEGADFSANALPMNDSFRTQLPYEATDEVSLSVSRCRRCNVALRRGGGFLMAGEVRCLRCTLMRPSLLRRSALTSLVVGTILTAINQGNLLVHGTVPAVLYWKIPLTYSVPFCVAIFGALVNSRPLTLPRSSRE